MTDDMGKVMTRIRVENWFALEDLDWVVDCRNQKLIPNPEHKHGELSDEF
jgi:hypothetical protein